ncbi:MAG: response regulator [Sphingomicrobium sp.]
MPLILLVDDDPLVADIVQMSLEAAGHTVGTLSDGRRALEVVEFKKPALVLLDCAMPFVPGVEVLRQIRSSRYCFDTPVLMLTARGGQTDRDIAMRAGASGYLRKPFDTQHLAMRVEEIIRDNMPRATAAPWQTQGKESSL